MSEEEQSLLNHSMPNHEINPIALNTVVAEINTWRTTKATQSEKTPEYIWDMVFLLLETHHEPDVLSACGLDKRQLNKERLERQAFSQIVQTESCNSVLANSYQKSFTSLANERKSFDMKPIATIHKNNGAFMNLYAVNRDIAVLVSTFLQS